MISLLKRPISVAKEEMSNILTVGMGGGGIEHGRLIIDPL